MDTMMQHDTQHRAHWTRVIHDAHCSLKSCGAPVGEMCRTLTGQPRYPHNRRQERAARTISCPRPSCQAAPGEMCGYQGRPQSWVCHVERTAAYEKGALGSRQL